MHSAAFVASMPPIAMTGIVVASQISRNPPRPIAGSVSPLDGVSQIGPTPM
jgi:hypothetical protein